MRAGFSLSREILTTLALRSSSSWEVPEISASAALILSSSSRRFSRLAVPMDDRFRLKARYESAAFRCPGRRPPADPQAAYTGDASSRRPL